MEIQLMHAIYRVDGNRADTSPNAAGPWDATMQHGSAPVGDWILLNAETWIGPDGAGIAAGRLGDSNGYFGRAVQSLVIKKR